MTVLPAPVPVSSFIRFCRWSALIVGIGWGAKRFSTNKRKEDAHRAYVAEMTPIWQAKRNELKLARERVELLALARDTGVAIPANFDQMYPPKKE